MQGKLRARDALRQNQADHVAHLRKAKLARVREQIKVFVGPVFSHLLVAHMSIVSEIADPNFVEKFMGLRPRKSMWTVSDGALAKYNADHPEKAFTFKRYVDMECNYLHTLVGEEYEDVLRQHPDSCAAKYYRRWLRRNTLDNWNPACALILEHSQALDQRPSAEEFKAKFGKSVCSPLMRNHLYLYMVSFVQEMQDVLRDWDVGNYSRMFPESNPLPLQLFRYFVGQITELRRMETAMGSANHKVQNDDKTGKGSMLHNSLSKAEAGGAGRQEVAARGKEEIGEKNSAMPSRYAAAAPSKS